MLASAGSNKSLARQLVQRGFAMRRLNVDIAAVTTIAAIGRALSKVCFSQKRNTAVSTSTSVKSQKSFV
jgi:hypothetical protein